MADKPRDGIPVEEDLAIRALLPEWRPKRGRRKAEDIEAEAESESSSAKKQNIQPSNTAFSNVFEEQYSATPSTGINWSAQGSAPDAWMAAQVAIAPKTPNSTQTPTNNQLGAQRAALQTPWRFNGNNTTNNETPATPYPHSAITPRQQFSASPKFDEPRSAHPSTRAKSPSRSRKRHTPAVSSAWPSSTNGSTGRIRGRPPSNRSVQDGPFSTFPANPQGKDNTVIITASPNNDAVSASTISEGLISQTTTETSLAPPGPAISNSLHPDQYQNQPPASGQQNSVSGATTIPARKPSKLQLQVPAHSGGPVRLATPPRVLINGESSHGTTNGINHPMGRSVSSSSGGSTQQPNANTHPPTHHERHNSSDFFAQLDDALEDRDVVPDETTVVDEDEGSREDWKRRALALRRKLAEKEEELKRVKRKVLDAVM